MEISEIGEAAPIFRIGGIVGYGHQKSDQYSSFGAIEPTYIRVKTSHCPRLMASGKLKCGIEVVAHCKNDWRFALCNVMFHGYTQLEAASS